MIACPRFKLRCCRQKEALRRSRVTTREGDLAQKSAFRPVRVDHTRGKIIQNSLGRSKISLQHRQVPVCSRNVPVGIDVGRYFSQNISAGSRRAVTKNLEIGETDSGCVRPYFKEAVVTGGGSWPVADEKIIER